MRMWIASRRSSPRWLSTPETKGTVPARRKRAALGSDRLRVQGAGSSRRACLPRHAVGVGGAGCKFRWPGVRLRYPRILYPTLALLVLLVAGRAHASPSAIDLQRAEVRLH